MDKYGGVLLRRFGSVENPTSRNCSEMWGTHCGRYPSGQESQNPHPNAAKCATLGWGTRTRADRSVWECAALPTDLSLGESGVALSSRAVCFHHLGRATEHSVGNLDSNSERRHCVRRTLHAPAFASFDGVTGGMILDLSAEGMAMQGAAPVEARGEVQVQLELSEPAGRLETTGYIAWADALGRAGVRFSELPEEARRRLEEWLALNAGAPTRMAPKLTVGRTALPGWGSKASEGKSSEGRASEGRTSEGRAVGGGARERASISLEADSFEGEWGSEGGAAGISGTMQYEFRPLSTDFSAALRLVGERARSLTRGSSAAIALMHKGLVMCRASVGNSAPALGTRLDVNSGFCGECFRGGKSLRCDDAEIDPRVDAETCGRMGVRSILAAPIRFERETMGLLVVFAEHPFTFDEGDVAVVESLAHTVLVSMRQAEGAGRV